MSEKTSKQTSKSPTRTPQPVELIEKALDELQGGCATRTSDPEFKYVSVRRF